MTMETKTCNCIRCKAEFQMPKNFHGVIVCESCDPFMNKSAVPTKRNVRYKITIDYDVVRGDWSIRLSKKWLFFWIPSMWIWSNHHYRHNTDFIRWKENLNPIIIINGKPE